MSKKPTYKELEQRVKELEKNAAERIEVEEALADSSKIPEKLFDTIHLCIVYLDKDFNFIRVNKAYAETCGYDPEYFIGKNHFDLYPSDAESIFRRVVKTGQPYTVFARPFEFHDDPERGTTYWDWTLQPLKDSCGKVEGLIF